MSPPPPNYSAPPSPATANGPPPPASANRRSATSSPNRAAGGSLLVPPPPPPPPPSLGKNPSAFSLFTSTPSTSNLFSSTSSPTSPSNAAKQHENSLLNASTSSPLDDPRFDAVSHVNLLFPNQSSIAQVDSLLSTLRRRVAALDDKIQDNLRQQTGSTTTTTDASSAGGAIAPTSAPAATAATSANELELVTKAMQELVGHVVSIKEKSKESERVVVDMTRDIKSLDYAKRNLTQSMAVLRRLSMLSLAVKQLKEHASRREYRQIVPLLQAIRQLETHFRSFRNVPKVAQLINSLHFIQSDLRKQILDLFDASFTSQAQLQPTADRNVLHEACMVLDGLEPSGRQQLLDWYASLVLREYRTLFNGKDELTSLENVPRRFSWLKRYLKLYDDDHSAIFPGPWRADHDICSKFATDTRQGLADAAQSAPKDKETGTAVKLLAKTMKATVEFEQLLTSRWAAVAQGDAPAAYGTMSEALEPYLAPMIDAEERRIAEVVGGFAGQLAVDEGNSSVLASSTELFVLYKDVLSTVTKLSRGRLVAELAKSVLAKYLDKYAEMITGMAAGIAGTGGSASSAAAAVAGGMMGVLTGGSGKPLGSFLGALGSNVGGAGSGADGRAMQGSASGTGSSPSSAHGSLMNVSMGGSGGAAGAGLTGTAATAGAVSVETWRTMCVLLNTAQYCATITSQLAEKLAEKTLPAYHAQINLDKQVDGFKAAAMSTVKSMVRVLLDTACEPAWQAMSKISWAQMQAAGDVSAYIPMIAAAVQVCVPAVAGAVAEAAMVRTFCDKVAEAVPTKYTQVLVKCKPISEAGAEQMLLDVHGLKIIVQKIPTLADPDAQISAVYTKIVTRGFSKLETFGKVLLTPAYPLDGLVTTFVTVVPEKERTKAALAQILELKGIKRHESSQALEMLAQQLAALAAPPPVSELAGAAGLAAATGAPPAEHGGYHHHSPQPSVALRAAGAAMSEATAAAANAAGSSAAAAASQMKRMFTFGGAGAVGGGGAGGAGTSNRGSGTS